MALNLAPFCRWTLRDRAAQRRLALRFMTRSFLRRYRLVLLTTPLFVLPMWHYSLMHEDTAGFVKDSGVVVDLVKVQPRTDFARYQSVIEYSGSEGQRLRFVDPVQRRPPETVGRSVDILVEPIARRRAYRAGLTGHWGFDFGITTFLSLSFFALAVGVTYFSNRSVKQRRERIQRRRRKE